MEEYIFVLGRNPELSLLEIFSYCKRKQINQRLKYHDKQIALFSLSSPANIKELGGILKIGKKIKIRDIIPEKNKITYSFSHFGSKTSMLDDVKELFKKERVKALLKYTQLDVVPPSKSSSLNWEFIQFNKDLFKIIAISDPKSYKLRDEARPSFDPLKVISIRLAKILINLAEADREILDPFCGNATILQEALLLNYDVVGIDKNIAEARKNISWLGKNYKKKAKLIQGDARTISTLLSKAEAVVTEPYLGPYLKKLPSPEEAKKIMKELEELYRKVLQELAKIVSGKVIIILPQIRTFTKKITLNQAILEEAGFSLVSLPASLKNPLHYEKKKSRVERFIYILEKLK